MATIASAGAKFKEYFDDGDPDEIFILEEEIASGSFGAVYKGKHHKDGKHYAVKIITPEEDEVLDDFMVEISILKRCNHENIVGYNGAWIKGEELFIAMELCSGGAITDVFALCDDPLTEDQIRLITAETLKGLVYMHANQMIHRDLKGANILLTGSGDVKLVDFGVSAELRKEDEKRFTLIGTPYWMAPEVIANKTGRQAYDHLSDMWSLGITLIELAEMNPPLHEIHPMKALMMIPMREPPALAHPDKWSADFKTFLNKCLQKTPEKRPTAQELLNHPFCQNLPPKQCLLDLIKKRDELEALEDDFSDSDELSEDNFSSDNLPPPPVGVDATAIAAAGAALPPPPMSPMTPPSPKIEPRTKAEEKAAAHEQAAQRKTARKLEQTEGANRPTYRTNKKLTQRQIKEHEKQLVNRQVLKDHMKQIRAMKSRHDKEEERLGKQLRRELDASVAKVNGVADQRFADIEKTQDRGEKAVEREQQSSLQRYEAECARLKRDLEGKLKKNEKQAVTDSKNDLKLYQKEQKQSEKAHKDETKAAIKERRLSKKEAKSFEVQKQEVFHDTKEWSDLKFRQDQDTSRMQNQFEQREMLREDIEKAAVSSRKEVQDKVLDVLRESQRQDAEAVHKWQVAQTEGLDERQPLEERHMASRHKMELAQLEEQMETERDQQQELLSSEMTQQKKQLRVSQTKETQELALKLKKLQKETKNKKAFRGQATQLKDELKMKFKKEDDELRAKQDKQVADETEMVDSHQRAKRNQIRETHENEEKELKERHEKERRELREAQEKFYAECEERWRNGILELGDKQGGERTALQAEHSSARKGELEQFHAQQLKLLEDHHKAQTDLRKRQKTVGADVMSALQQEQEEEAKTLSLKHAQLLDVFSREADMMLQEARQTQEADMNALKQQSSLIVHTKIDPKGTLRD